MRGKCRETPSTKVPRAAQCRLMCLHLLLLVAASTAFAGIPGESEPLTTLLPPVPQGFALVVDLDLSTREVRFQSEPEYQGADIVRAAIPLGDDDTAFVGFAWDKQAGLLYIDSNRNLDLTDDPQSPYRAADTDVWITVFKDILLVIERDAFPIEYIITMRLGPEWFSDAVVVSGWQDSITIGKSEYIVTVVDNLDGKLGADDQFYLTGAGEKPPETPTTDLDNFFLDSTAWGVPGHLAVAGATYAVDAAFEKTGQGVAARVQFLPPAEPLGELRLKGTHIREFVLVKHPSAPMLAYPSGNAVHVPPGSYRLTSLILESGWKLQDVRHIQNITVHPERPATLDAGGPLRESITMNSRLNRIELFHQVKGVGGAIYTNDARFAEPPRFAVYKGDKRVHAANFEYG